MTTLLMPALLAVTATPSAGATDGDIAPSSVKVARGSVAGTLAALGVMDQLPGDDDPAAHLLLRPERDRFVAQVTVRLPQGLDPTDLAGATVEVKVRVPAGGGGMKQRLDLGVWRRAG